MAAYEIEVSEEAKLDLLHYSAFERKIITSEIRAQLANQPTVETKNRKPLRDNPLASWETSGWKTQSILRSRADRANCSDSCSRPQRR